MKLIISEDNLKQYFKIGFKDEETYNEFTFLTDFQDELNRQNLTG